MRSYSRRRPKAELLTEQILCLLHEIGRIHTLTEDQAYQIKEAVEAGARELHFQRKVMTETPHPFALKPETP